MKCLLDMDGVLVDFVQGIADAIGLENPYNKPEARGIYAMEKLWGITIDEFWKPTTEEFWANLPWMPDGMAILKLCERTFGSENICLLTRPGPIHGTEAGKTRWVQDNMPEYRDRLLMGGAKHFLAHSGVVLVDDYDKNVTSFIEHGGHAVTVPRRWNALAELELDPIGSLTRQLEGIVNGG